MESNDYRGSLELKIEENPHNEDRRRVKKRQIDPIKSIDSKKLQVSMFQSIN